MFMQEPLALHPLGEVERVEDDHGAESHEREGGVILYPDHFVGARFGRCFAGSGGGRLVSPVEYEFFDAQGLNADQKGGDANGKEKGTPHRLAPCKSMDFRGGG